MKINQIGIQSYQTINKPDMPTRQTERVAGQQNALDTITLTPQSEAAGSQLAVRASGNGYADLLTPTEKTALELLFAKYQERAQNNATYGAGSNNPDTGLGVLLDVKG
jgi:hypothetical protein